MTMKAFGQVDVFPEKRVKVLTVVPELVVGCGPPNYSNLTITASAHVAACTDDMEPDNQV